MVIFLFCIGMTCVQTTSYDNVPRFYLRGCMTCDAQLVGPTGRVWAIVRTGGKWIREP